MTYAVEYSWNSLATHEWSKHGSCTGWNQSQYFKTAEDMYNRMRTGAGFAFLSANVGNNVTYDDLYAAFEKDTQGKKLALQCVSCAFSEAWTAWAADPVTKLPTSPIDIVDPDSCESCSLVKILEYDGCGVSHCVSGEEGPACTYDSTAGTTDDPCLQYAGCLRCPKSTHDGVHYCTSQPA